MRDSWPTATEVAVGVAEDPVLQTLEQYAPTLAAARRLLVAFSGGLDSSALLYAISQAYPGVTALHADHGLHEDTGHWVAHCEAFCKQLDVTFESTSLVLADAGEGVEAAARTARYQWFEECVAAGDVLLMAHHQDDQAETLLLRLLRGAGPEGLAGIPVRRTLGSGVLLRPFLDVPRRDLRAYAMSKGLSWIDDPSNSDTRYDRNYLRREVMPLLARRWPGYRATLSRAATQLRELNDHMPAPELSTVRGCLEDPGFLLSGLPDEPALAAVSVRRWLRERVLLMPPAARLQEFLRQLSEGGGAQLCGADWVIERYRDAVYLHPSGLESAPRECAVRFGEWQSWPGVGQLAVERGQGPAIEGLVLRTRQGGERLEFSSGQRKDLKTVFQELEVPPWWRDSVPLLVQRSDSGEELLAVAHLRRSPRAESLGVEVVLKEEEFP